MSEQMIENVVPTTEETEVQVEQIADESAKVYSEADFQRMREEYERKMDKKVSRREAKVRKELERKYGDLENVLRAGTGKETVEEMTDAFTDFYTRQGVDIPKKPQYNSKDNEILANYEAEEIIKGGFEEVIEEADRLKELGLANMSEKEKVLFRRLTDYVKDYEQSKDLDKLGVSKDVYTGQEFKEFASKFNSNTPITDIYNIYNSTKPKKEIPTVGSMKSQHTIETVKDFYTVEEAKKISRAELDRNPKLYEAIKKSMLLWNKK